MDQVLENGKRLIETTWPYGIELYLIAKQFGRDPWLTEELLVLGYNDIATIDYKETQIVCRAGLPVAHRRYLVQIPCHQVSGAVEQGTDAATVFTLDRVREIFTAAMKTGRMQSVLFKVYSDNGFLYPRQEGGFIQHSLREVVAEIQSLPGLHLAGLTHSPYLLWDETAGKVLPTPNLRMLIQTQDQLAKSGIVIEQLNAPSTTSCASLPLLAEYGMTHAEPGHALTGTIPADQQGDRPECIAILWLSEISHHFRDGSYCYGGGCYRRGHVQYVLVFMPGNQRITRTYFNAVDDSSIGYTLPLTDEHPIDNAVIPCFRTQTFITRSGMMLMSGIHHSEPEIIGCYDNLGNPLEAQMARPVMLVTDSFGVRAMKDVTLMRSQGAGANIYGHILSQLSYLQLSTPEILGLINVLGYTPGDMQSSDSAT